jgi:hypothetical protein
MIPVPNQKLAIIAWSRMEKADCHPCGVLVYAGDAHSAVSTYMREGGMETADGLFRVQAGSHYAFITTAIPTDTWCDYAEAQNVFWWQWFGHSFRQWQFVQASAPAKTGAQVTAQAIAQTTQIPTQTGEPTTATGAAVVTTEGTTDVTDQVVVAVERELLAHPDDQIGTSKQGQPIQIGRLQSDPRWRWYYEGPYAIARIFRIDTRDVPCLKVRVSFQNKSGQRFRLDGVAADQMTPFLQQLATGASFMTIVRDYRP